MQNLRSELIRSNQGPEDNSLKNILMELKLRWQIIGKLIKRLDEEKNLSNYGIEKRSNCKIEDILHSPTFRRIQDILH